MRVVERERQCDDDNDVVVMFLLWVMERPQARCCWHSEMGGEGRIGLDRESAALSESLSSCRSSMVRICICMGLNDVVVVFSLWMMERPRARCCWHSEMGGEGVGNQPQL